MQWWVVVVAVAFCHGCLRDDLVRCGDRYCPTTSTCMAGRCIDPQQIVACDGVAEGDGCVVLDTAGTCQAGLCEIAGRCGDAYLDVGEVCDDGNKTDGDGCSRTCASDETCGNGVLDLAETCDCGRDAATQPLGCPTVNNDDKAALCDTSCTRLCGDNIVTGLEACDGTEVPATCEDFGFYTGTVTCSPFCTFVRACEGQCGDGDLQEAFGEICDGDDTVEDSCVDFGRDYGVLGCNQFCNPDVGSDCAFYGWTLLAETSTVTEAQANDDGTIIKNIADVEVNYRGAKKTFSRTVSTHVYATADTFVTIDDKGIGELDIEAFDPNTLDFVRWGGVITLSGGWEARGDGKTLYVLEYESCKLLRLEIANGVTTPLPEIDAANCVSFDVLDDAIVVATADQIYVLDNGIWDGADATVTQVAWYGRGQLAIVKDGLRSIITRDGAPVPSQSLSDVSTVATTAGADLTRTNGGAVFAHVGYIRFELTKDLAIAHVARDGSGHVIAWSEKAVYRMGAVWSSVDAIEGYSEQPDGSFVHFQPAAIGPNSWAPGNGTPNSVAGTPPGDHYVASSTGLYYFKASQGSYTQVLGGPASVYATKTATYAIASGSFYELVDGNPTAKSAPTGCTTALDAAASSARIVALFTCASAPGQRLAYEIVNSAWQPIGSGTIGGGAIALGHADDTVFVIAANGFFQLETTNTWTLVSIPGSVLVSSFAARRRNDVYVQPQNQLSRYYHWDGARLDPLRHLSPLQITVTQATALDSGLYVSSTQGNGLLSWWGPTPAGL